ncbi:MAG: hypothetical protein WBD52_09135 [Phycisphaerae bacterium]
MSKDEPKKEAEGVYFDIGQNIPIRAGDGEASGVSFAHFQANRQAAPAMNPMLDDHLPILLEQFQQAYAAYGIPHFVVSAVEKGTVFQPSEWLPRAYALRNGGAVSLGKDGRKPVVFMFFVVRESVGEKGEEAVEGFCSLAAKAGSLLTFEDRTALGIERETRAEAAWLTFVMSQLLGSRFIVERKDATFLINPFVACMKVLEDVAHARQDAKVAEAGGSEGEADKPKGQSGEWSPPLSLAVLMKRMDCESMDTRTFKSWVEKKYGLMEVSRQLYQIRLDIMPDNLRACVEGTAKP